MTGPDVCVLIPTLNEADTIGNVIDEFQSSGFDSILVMDGHSTDNTREIAESMGTDVRVQSGKGKGQAVREAISIIDTPITLIVDGDGTYRPSEATRLLEPIKNGDADHVIGNRFADMSPGAMTRLNKIGNQLINTAFRTIHGHDFEDILSGYRAISTGVLSEFFLTADGFGIETELAVESAKHNVRTVVVPISYDARPSTSTTNLRPVRDGGSIILTLYRLAKTNNPLFYFGSIGLLSWLFGTGLAGYVGYRWVVFGVSHEILAILAAFTVLFGVQLVMFGVLSDMILALHRAQLQRFRG